MDIELIIEIIAVITGLLSIWFSYKINILVYPIGMISLALYVFIFIRNGLYANSVINFLYFIISIFGWWNWKRNSINDTTSQQSSPSTLQVGFLNRKQRTITIVIIGILFYIATRFANDINILSDYITGILGLGAMLLTAYKKVENWILYLVCDIILIPLCIYNELYFTSFQYLGYTILAVMGYFNWRKEALNHV